MRTKEVVGTVRKGVSLDTGSASLKPEGQASFEMANLRPDRTGLPFVVFISQRGGARDNVRVKVARAPRVRPSEMVTVALRPSVRVIRGRLEPHDLDLLRRWIEMNAQVIIDYLEWYYRIHRRRDECPQADWGLKISVRIQQLTRHTDAFGPLEDRRAQTPESGKFESTPHLSCAMLTPPAVAFGRATGFRRRPLGCWCRGRRLR